MPRATDSPFTLPALRTSILRKAIRQSFLLAAMAVAILTLIGFLTARSLLLQMDPEESWHGIKAIGITFATVDILVFLLAAALAYFLSKDLTASLRSLACQVVTLGPGRWSLPSHVRSGDEVELLDRTIEQMAGRLRHIYEHLEEEVRERTRDLQTQFAIDKGILDGVQQGILLVDREGNIMQVNPAACLLLQREEESIVGARAQTVVDMRTHRGETLADEHAIVTCLRTRAVVHSDPAAHVSLARPDGTLLPILYVATPFLQEGNPLGCIVVIHDVTEERQIDYMKSDFITLASHQLRTPLSSIRWYLDLFLEEKNVSTDQQGYLTEMQHALDRMVNLLNALLHAARLEGEGVTPAQQSVDLAGIVTEMVETMQEQARATGVTCVMSVPSRAVTLCTDGALLRIILQNLISNALKYSRQGTTVTVRLIEENNEATIDVQDEGVGIPLSEQHRVFQKFFRAQNVRTMDTDGSGLGLYITKSMIDRLKGRISFRSVEGKGTRFTIGFPRGATDRECPRKEGKTM